MLCIINASHSKRNKCRNKCFFTVGESIRILLYRYVFSPITKKYNNSYFSGVKLMKNNIPYIIYNIIHINIIYKYSYFVQNYFIIVVIVCKYHVW